MNNDKGYTSNEQMQISKANNMNNDKGYTFNEQMQVSKQII